MINCQEFHRYLQKEGINFFAGVPDSLLKDFSAYLADNVPEPSHVICANEGNAIAAAAGYYLGTGRPGLVYMQNAGLGNAVNPLVSLTDETVYRIPELLMIGWRGEPEVQDEPQHVKQGKITLALLETLGIAYAILDARTSLKKIFAEASVQLAHRRPFALVVRKDTFAEYQADTTAATTIVTRETALKGVLDCLRADELVVATTGKLSRELFEYRQETKTSHASDFLTVGSMGHTSSIALGIAVSQAEKTVVCLDGDGSVIMHMGALAVVGHYKPGNLKHVVFNNNAHDSVGGQPTAGGSSDLVAIARSCGYRHAARATSHDDIITEMKKMLPQAGPGFLEIVVNKGARANLGRPAMTPVEMGNAFKDFARSRVVLRAGARHDVAQEIRRRGHRVLVVSELSTWIASGAGDSLRKHLAQFQTCSIHSFASNVTCATVAAAVAKARKYKPDVIVAIGGGSSIDMAKLIAFFYALEKSPGEYVTDPHDRPKAILPIVALPTTAGSGSEATHFAVVYQDRKKYSVADERLRPTAALIDPDWLISCPPAQIAISGADALAQAIESYWGNTATEQTKGWSAEAMGLILENLPRLYKRNTLQARMAMSKAAWLAGRSIDITKTSAPHAFSYGLTACYGVPHGQAVAAFVPDFLVFNSQGEEKVSQAIQEIIALLGTKNVEEGRQFLKKFFADLGLTLDLTRVGWTPEEVVATVIDSINVERLRNNPREITLPDAQELIQASLFAQEPAVRVH